jgi:hypothetical protein
MVDLKCIHFVLLMTPFEDRLNQGGLDATAKDECLVTGMDVCKAVLPLLDGSVALYPIRTILPMTFV